MVLKKLTCSEFAKKSRIRRGAKHLCMVLLNAKLRFYYHKLAKMSGKLSQNLLFYTYFTLIII